VPWICAELCRFCSRESFVRYCGGWIASGHGMFGIVSARKWMLIGRM
jgi:hypothetical protein